MSATHQHCAACGATLAPDQRYCVECGQRRGPARMPFAQQAAQTPPATSAPPQRRGPRMSVNATLIASIGTLMLAMGTGVLIGRSAASSNASSQTPYQVITVPGATSATGTGATQTPSTEASGGTGGSGGASGGGSGKAAKSKSTSKSNTESTSKSKKAVVTVGTHGKGPGYEKGEFTGKFFGGSSSESEEEEEE